MSQRNTIQHPAPRPPQSGQRQAAHPHHPAQQHPAHLTPQQLELLRQQQARAQVVQHPTTAQVNQQHQQPAPMPAGQPVPHNPARPAVNCNIPAHPSAYQRPAAPQTQTQHQPHPAHQQAPQQRLYAPAVMRAPMPSSHSAAAQPARAPHQQQPPHAPQHNATPQQPAPQPATEQSSKKTKSRLLLSGAVIALLCGNIGLAALYVDQDKTISNLLSRLAPAERQAAEKQSLTERLSALSLSHTQTNADIRSLEKRHTDLKAEMASLLSNYAHVRVGSGWMDSQQVPDIETSRPLYDPQMLALLPEEAYPVSLREQETTQVASLEPSEALSASPSSDTLLPLAQEAQPNNQIDLTAQQSVQPEQQTETSAATEGTTEASPALTVLTALPRPKERRIASLAPELTPAPEAQTQRQPLLKPSGSNNKDFFLSKMRALKQGQLDRPLTILHIGDSHIASDSFTRGIRKRLQASYGNAGRGAVIPAKAYKYAYADGLSLAASKGWKSYNSLRSKSGPYGLSGVRVTTTSRGANMKLTSKNGSFDWATVTLYTGPKQGSVTISTDAGSKTVSARSASAGSKLVRIDGRGKRVTIKHNGSGATTVLNWATGKNTPGIRYVNFGIAGATVDVTKRWSTNLLQNDIRNLKPDLIVYGYGTNEGYNDNITAKGYNKSASNFVSKLTQAAPNAALMFIGPADGARRRAAGGASCGGGWYTPKKLATVRSTLQSLAQSYNGLYWNWADAMGGRCGANRWSGKRLAAKDRVHLTAKGYDVSASSLVNYLNKQVGSGSKLALKQ